MTYLPVKGEPFTVSMGLRAMPLETWIEIDQHYKSELDEKRRLLTKHPDKVFAALPNGLSGSKETLAMLLDYLPKHFPERFPDQIKVNLDEHPLLFASLLVQEDLVIMSPQNNNWVLTAASVCFPSRWDLSVKVGADLHAIHEPVPHYEERIGHATDVMFDKLTSDRPVWRINWTILDSPELFQPALTGEKARVPTELSKATFGDNMYFRTERQTLWKLPVTGDILFTIRTYVDSLNNLADRYPEFREHLGQTLLTTSVETRAYKGWLPVWDDLLAWTKQEN